MVRYVHFVDYSPRTALIYFFLPGQPFLKFLDRAHVRLSIIVTEKLDNTLILIRMMIPGRFEF